MRLCLLACYAFLLSACDRPSSPELGLPSSPASPSNGVLGRSVVAGTGAAAEPGPPGVLGGIYQGLLPCADCAGIETVLYLYPDSTYLERRTYLDQPKEGSNEQLSSGRWAQVSADLVRLTRRNQTSPTDYKLHARSLQQLDLDGQEITGDLAARYYLAQVGNF